MAVVTPIGRDFVNGGRFNSPRMTRMQRISTDFLEKIRGNLLHPRYPRPIPTSDAAILIL